MQLEWLVTDVAPVGSPDRAENCYFGDDFGRFVSNSGRFCDQGVTL